MHLRHTITTIVTACALSACASSPAEQLKKTNSAYNAANDACTKMYPFRPGYVANLATCLGTNDIEYGTALVGPDTDLLSKMDAEHAVTGAQVDHGQISPAQGMAAWDSQKQAFGTALQTRQENRRRSAVVAAQHPAISPP
ncbi:hypothetical protein C0V97_12530 [Asaia sp. W19]|nr:hypothetical protein C0V97_12530 [Asaia sp. W19]